MKYRIWPDAYIVLTIFVFVILRFIFCHIADYLYFYHFFCQVICFQYWQYIFFCLTLCFFPYLSSTSLLWTVCLCFPPKYILLGRALSCIEPITRIWWFSLLPKTMVFILDGCSFNVSTHESINKIWGYSILMTCLHFALSIGAQPYKSNHLI